MTKLTENAIEALAIQLLQEAGYEYLQGGAIAPEGESPERTSFEDVVLTGRLQAAVARINPRIPVEAQQEAIKEVQRIQSPVLVNNNEAFHQLLVNGIDVQLRKNGEIRGDKVWLIDFERPEQNEFLVVDQFTVIEKGNNKRPDLVLFVNGLPLVVIELKNASDEQATVRKAYDQLQTYKATIPSLFTYNNGILIASDGLEALAGSLTAGFSRFMAWKTADGKTEASTLVSQLETLIKGMLNKATLMDLLQNFIVFQKKSSTSKEGIASVETIKILTAYHQYYAVNKAVISASRAAGYAETSNLLDDPGEIGDRKGGVIWHTQGSGKSLSMVFFAGKMVRKLDNPTIVVLTDRNDLDDQLFDTFAASRQLLRQDPQQAEDRQDLKDKLKVASGGIVFTTIHKFSPDSGNIYEELSDRKNIIVVADEAHRTQYGFKAKMVDEKDEGGNVIGQRIAYGFAKYMRDALPNATYIGFTGTPVEFDDKNTPAVFGHYIDIYDIARAVEDKATVPIYYESRLAKVNLTEDGKKMVEEMDSELESEELDEIQKLKAKWTKLEAIVGSEERIENIAKDIIDHFEKRQEVFEGKAMVVAMSRRIAVKLYDEIVKLRPDWHDEDLTKGSIKVVMTASSADGPQMAKHHTTKQQRRELADRMKEVKDPLKLVIVRDMWLTGFDAPCMHTLYIDKPMKGHNLMQAIARVNRVFKDKPGGLVVDYLGIAFNLKKALAFYSESGGKGNPTETQEKAVELMEEKLEVVSQIFDESSTGAQEYQMVAEPGVTYGNRYFPYEHYFTAETSEKLSIILAAEDYILGLEKGKERYIREVTALSKAYAIALPHEKAMEVKDEVAFFQAVKARLVKFNRSENGRNDEEMETAIRQVVDQAIVSEQVIDIFDAAGIKKPDISILSEEFLEDVKGMKHKNLALEVLKKILNDEIKARTKTNLVQSKSLMEMLESSIKRYQNNIVTAAEIIQELIDLAKKVKEADKRGEKLGLTEYELAFYDAVSQNESARQLMQSEVLCELAKVLVTRVKEGATIDWTIKESVRAKLKVIVKRTLRQFGYPPDLQALAVETVLKQAEYLAEFFTEKEK